MNIKTILSIAVGILFIGIAIAVGIYLFHSATTKVIEGEAIEKNPEQSKLKRISIILFGISLLLPVFSLDLLGRLKGNEIIGIGALLFGGFIGITNGIAYWSRVANISYFMTLIISSKIGKKVLSIITVLIGSLAFMLPGTKYEGFGGYITINTLSFGFLLRYCSFILLAYSVFQVDNSNSKLISND